MQIVVREYQKRDLPEINYSVQKDGGQETFGMVYYAEVRYM